MTSADRDRLRRLLASFDEAGLVALANVGLVRRARKDLEAGGVSHEETDAAVIVRGPDWTVTMPPEGPTRAADSTRATGVTRQILAATIYLRDKWAADAPAAEAPPAVEPAGESAADALLALTVEDLQKWAGKTVVKEAFALMARPPAVEIESHAGLTIRLTDHAVEARVFHFPGRKPAQLLEAILTTAPKALHARWAVVAVLAFQASRGKVAVRPEASVAAEPAGSPVSRKNLLIAARDTFAGMVATGLAHPSDRTAQRLFTLSVSAGASGLPRLARLVRSLADDVGRTLERHASADAGRLFGRLCTADALVRALLGAGAAIPVTLAGRPRSDYDPVGDPTLAGVGAYPWQTASGYEGVTLVFWEAANARFLTYTTSRPAGQLGKFGLESAYRDEAVWRGGGAGERLSRSTFVLRNARVNPAGRLSGAKECAADVGEPTEPGKLDFGPRQFADWSALASYAASTDPLGLAEGHPLDRLVVLRPAAWGERTFDELQQELRWGLIDAAGRELAVTLPWNGINESAVEFLEVRSNPTGTRSLTSSPGSSWTAAASPWSRCRSSATARRPGIGS